MTAPAGRRFPVWLLVSLAWAGPAILAAFEAVMQARLGHRPAVTAADLVWEAGDWLAYGLLTPAVFWMARRYPLRTDLARRLPLHAGAAVVLCGAWAAIGVLLRWAVYRAEPTPDGALGWFLTSLPFGVAVYFALVGAAHAAVYYVEAQARETQAARLAAQLAEARLGALRMQLQPHFLYNSLNALAVVLRDQDTATAARMVEELGELLRRVTRSAGAESVPLADEVDFLRRYLALEAIRFPDRLRPVIAVPAALERALVPEFILQPLVENAIRHGLAKRADATRLEIAAARIGDELELTVTDDGPGPATGRRDEEGVGLANVRERLATLFGHRGTLTLGATPGGGAVARVRLPWREEDPA